MLLGLACAPCLAGGPLSVDGTGVPLRWGGLSAINWAGFTPIVVTYNADLGGLGTLDNSSARDLVADAFLQWSAIQEQGKQILSFVEGLVFEGLKKSGVSG